MTDERDVVAEVEAALAYCATDHGLFGVALASDAHGRVLAEQCEHYQMIADAFGPVESAAQLLTTLRALRGECDRLKAEVKEWKAEATKWRDEAEKVVNDAHARITEQQGQIDTLKAEVEKLKAELAEVVAKKCDACEEVEQTRDGWMVENTRLSENLQAEREAHAKTKAAHEQDIEAAWLQGWEDCYAYASVFTADPTAPDRQEAVARFKASRKGGSDDKG